MAEKKIALITGTIGVLGRAMGEIIDQNGGLLFD